MSLIWIAVYGTFALIIAVALVQWKIRHTKNQLQCQHTVPAPDEFNASTEVVIIGSGILGSSLATVLGRDNRKVTVIERDLAEPDRIVGELLQPGGFNALKKLGLEDAVQDIDSHIVKGYIIHDTYSGTNIKLSYPVDETGRTYTGRSFHHGRFVMGLRRQAKNEPNVNLIEGTVNSLLENKAGDIVGVEYREKHTGILKTIKANLTVVADGCFSRFRKDLVAAPVSVWSNFVGLIMHNVPQLAVGHAEIVLGNSGPILVYQISSTCTRILIDVPEKLPQDMKEYLKTNTAPQLPDYMKKPFMEALKQDRFRSMPNSFLPPLRIPNPKRGVIILGDAFNMRHPLTGAGMSVALNDILLLRKTLRSIHSFKETDLLEQGFKEFYWNRKRSHSFVVNVLAQALYALFSSPEGPMNDLRQACFEYFKLGGRAISGPIGLLSVLSPYPSILIGHFFLVAFYAIYRTAVKHLPMRVDLVIYKSVIIFIRACGLIFPLIFSELQAVIM